MAEKQNQRVMLTKKLLKNSLTEMLQTEDVYRISIRELCERAGINRSTFYKYYGSQFDLLAEMEQDMLGEIELALSAQSVDEPGLLSELLRYLERNIDFVRRLLNSSVDLELAQKLFSMPRVHERIGRLIGTDLPPEEFEYASSFLIFGAYQIVRMWLNKENRESPEWLSALIIRQFNASRAEADR